MMVVIIVMMITWTATYSLILHQIKEVSNIGSVDESSTGIECLLNGKSVVYPVYMPLV